MLRWLLGLSGGRQDEEAVNAEDDPYDPASPEYLIPASVEEVEAGQLKLLRSQIICLEDALEKRRSTLDPSVAQHYTHVLDEMYGSPTGMRLARQHRRTQSSPAPTELPPSRERHRHLRLASEPGRPSEVPYDDALALPAADGGPPGVFAGWDGDGGPPAAGRERSLTVETVRLVEAEAPPGWETDSEAGEETMDAKESLAVESEASASTMEACERSGSSPEGAEGSASSLEDTEAPGLIPEEGDTSGGGHEGVVDVPEREQDVPEAEGCKNIVDVPERGQDVQDSEGSHKREHMDQCEQDHILSGDFGGYEGILDLIVLEMGVESVEGSPTDVDKKCPEVNHVSENEVAYDGCVGSSEKIRAGEAPSKAETCEEGSSTSAHWRFWEVLGSVVGLA